MKWEYQILTINHHLSDSPQLSALNQAGQVGWDLVQIERSPDGTQKFYMKRPLQEVKVEAKPRPLGGR